MGLNLAESVIVIPDSHALLRLGVVGKRFNALVSLSNEDCDVLGSCLSQVSVHGAGHELLSSGAFFLSPKLLLSGWACLSRNLPDGRRQIIDIFLPGDIVGYSSHPEARSRGSYHCLTDGRYANAREIVALAESGALPERLASGLRLMEEEFNARLVEHVVRNGRMLSHERLAHLAHEIYRRLKRVGLVTDESFPMPLTQEILGDILGMSTVHINRTLQTLRREHIIKTVNGRWQILDFGRLAAFAAGEYGRLNHEGIVFS